MKNTFNKGSTIFNALSIRENLAKAGLGKERVDEEVLAFEKSQ